MICSEVIKLLKKLLRRIAYQEKSDSETYVSFLKKRGVSVGKNVFFFDPIHTHVDDSIPHLLTIGDDVLITRGVTILCHDYSWAVLKKVTGDVIGAQSPVKIGNNVFLGMNAVITRGVTIGDNVIVGAGSIVTGDCEANSVYAGNPAKRIMSIDEFCAKRKSMQLQEATDVFKEYVNRFGTIPPKEVLREYFELFTTVDVAQNDGVFNSVLALGENYEESVEHLRDHPPKFDNYEQFVDYALKS